MSTLMNTVLKALCNFSSKEKYNSISCLKFYHSSLRLIIKHSAWSVGLLTKCKLICTQVSDSDKAAIERKSEHEQTEQIGDTAPPCNATQGPYCKKADELEALLENLNGKLSEVVAQVDYVKKVRDELYAEVDTLRESAESCDKNPKTEEEREKKVKEIMFGIKTRELVLKILEKEEIVLSHAVLSVVSNWADEMEKDLETRKSSKSLKEDNIQPHSEPETSYIMTS